MARLTRTQILEVSDLKQEEVEVPEWGGTVLVRELSALERETVRASLMDFDASGKPVMRAATPPDLIAQWVALGCIDDAGAPLFSAKDVAALAGKSVVALDRVARAIMRLSGDGASGAESSGVEAAAKN